MELPRSLSELQRPSHQEVEAAIEEGERMVDEMVKVAQRGIPPWDDEVETTRCTI